MKKKILLFIMFCFFVMIAPVFALDSIRFNKALDVSNVIDIVGYKDGYVLLKSDGELAKYDLDGNTTKKLNNFKAMGLLKYNDSFIVYGESENLVSIYILDSNLRVVHNSNLDILINGSVVNGYVYDNKVYFVLSLDSVISNTKIVSMDKSFNIEINNLSEVEELKDIFKSDYYLYDDGNFDKSILLNNYNYLIGNKDSKGILKRIEDSLVIEDELYLYKDVIVIGNDIVVLAKNDDSNVLIRYDEDGNVISRIELENGALSLDKFGNSLSIIYRDKVLVYDYDLEINKEDSLFGTITIDGEAVPYGEINVVVLANSGYEVEKIVIQSNTGETILLDNGKFIMPEDNVKVSVLYKEVVKNPETFDAIIWITLLSIVMIIVGRILYVKYKWLR